MIVNAAISPDSADNKVKANKMIVWSLHYYDNSHSHKHYNMQGHNVKGEMIALYNNEFERQYSSAWGCNSTCARSLSTI